jgi:hypothetical protein
MGCLTRTEIGPPLSLRLSRSMLSWLANHLGVVDVSFCSPKASLEANIAEIDRYEHRVKRRCVVRGE